MGVAYHLVCLFLRHLRELLHQHLTRRIVYRDILLYHHVVNTVQIACQTDGNHIAAVFGIQRKVVALLGFQVFVAETDLCLTTIHGEVVVIQFVEPRGTEASRVRRTETEILWRIHQRHLRRQAGAKRLVVVEP